MERNKCNRCFASVCSLLPFFFSPPQPLSPLSTNMLGIFYSPNATFFFCISPLLCFHFQEERKKGNVVEFLLFFPRCFDISLLWKREKKKRVVKQILLYRPPAAHECCSISVIFCKSLQVNASDHEGKKWKKRRKKREESSTLLWVTAPFCVALGSPL